MRSSTIASRGRCAYRSESGPAACNRSAPTWQGAGSPRLETPWSDLGTVSARDAVDFLLGLATREDTRAGEEAILPVTLADSVTVWPMLLRLARDDRGPQRTRRQAVFWLGQAAGDAATKDLTDLVDDADLDRDESARGTGDRK